MEKATKGNWRNYSLSGRDSDSFFTAKQWHTTPIPRARLKQLMKRSNKPTLINYGIWLFLTVLLGFCVFLTWGTYWTIPALIFYGIFYGSCADSRWHECAHGTGFKTVWLNEFFYHLTSIMGLKNPYVYRWSHTRHHSETIIVGRDPEIAFPRPPSPINILLNFLHIQVGWIEMKKMLKLSFGYLTQDQRLYIIEADRPKAFWTSRAHFLILIFSAGISFSIGSWLPLMLVGLPTFYGSGLHNLFSSLQHAGLVEDTPDYRLNTRTVHMNWFFRFVYSNMNYHLEHHMYPMVPFYALPALHEEIKDDCPPAYPNVWSAVKEMVPALIKQMKNPSYYIERHLPKGANPSPSFVRQTADQL